MDAYKGYVYVQWNECAQTNGVILHLFMYIVYVCIFTADCSLVYCDWAPGENWKHDLLWR